VAVIVKTADELRAIVVSILLAAEANERNAGIVAEHVISAHLAGIDTHGIWPLAFYMDQIRQGYLLPTAWPEILQETPTSALLTGNWGFGQVAAKYAMEVAIEKAQERGIAAVGIVQVTHIGRLGYYAELAALEGMISMIWAGGFGVGQPAAVPYGGRKTVLHTNPVSFGFPAGEETPMIIDFATTAASGVKVNLARDRKQQLPPGWIVDKDGNPTTNPDDFFEGGGHLPFGDHKGYALMMAVEFLGRIFTGTDAFAEADRGGPILRHQGVSMIVLRADLFQSLADYVERVDEMERRVRAIPPAPGFKEVLVPGDPEARTRAIRQQQGIPIPDDNWRQLVDVAESVGVKF
jgi:LDH2 family malate/lactate/ureidoglycolate dehydrogenase